MLEILYNKLFKDNIPEIIEANGSIAVTRTLDTQEFECALFDKLVEEAREFMESDGAMEERADVKEVLRTIRL